MNNKKEYFSKMHKKWMTLKPTDNLKALIEYKYKIRMQHTNKMDTREVNETVKDGKVTLMFSYIINSKYADNYGIKRHSTCTDIKYYSINSRKLIDKKVVEWLALD